MINQFLPHVRGLILAAGHGRRMRALTDPLICRHARPKAMLPFGTETLIDSSIAAFQRLGLRQVLVSTGPRPLSESLEQHLLDWEKRGMNVQAFREDRLRDTAGTLTYLMQNFMPVSRDDTIIVLPCDTPSDIELGPILMRHLEKNAAVTVGALPIPWSSPDWKERSFATIKLNVLPEIDDYPDRNLFEADLRKCAHGLEGEAFSVDGFFEKQLRDKTRSNLVSTSVYFFNAGFLMDLAPFITEKEEPRPFSDIGLHILPLLGGRLEEFRDYRFDPVFLRRVRQGDYPFFAYLLPAETYWRDVGNPWALWSANMELLDRLPARATSSTPPEISGKLRRLLQLVRRFGDKSIIEPTAIIHPGARIKHSVILGDSEVAGQVQNSIIFPGGFEVRPGDRMMRRTVIGKGVTLINCLLVGGALRADKAPRGVIKDRIIYVTVHGGLAYDPI